MFKITPKLLNMHFSGFDGCHVGISLVGSKIKNTHEIKKKAHVLPLVYHDCNDIWLGGKMGLNNLDLVSGGRL